MTPDEAALIQGLGRDWYTYFIAITNETFLLTVYGVMMLKAASILLTPEARRVRSYVINMAALTLLFLMAVALWCIDLTTFIWEPKFMMVKDPDVDLETKVDNTFAYLDTIWLAQAALYAWMPLIGDAIIVHRVWMLREFMNVYLIIVPALCLLGTFIGTIMLSWCTANGTLDSAGGSFADPPLCAKAQMVTYVLPAVTTAAATILIGFTAWKHAKRLAPLHTSSKPRRKTRVERVFLILVESGFFYFLFFFIQILGDIDSIVNVIDNNTTLGILMDMFDYSSSVMVGIYPTIIIVLAHSKRTTLATDYTGGGSSMGTNMSTLRAAPNSSKGSGTTFPVGLNSAATKSRDIEMGTVGQDEFGENTQGKFERI